MFIPLIPLIPLCPLLLVSADGCNSVLYVRRLKLDANVERFVAAVAQTAGRMRRPLSGIPILYARMATMREDGDERQERHEENPVDI